MNDNANKPKQKRRWTRWGWWSFIILNILGLLLIIPLLKVVYPLIGIWWTTHSQANFQRHQQQQPSPAAAQGRPDPGSTTAASPQNPDTDLHSLTNQLEAINRLSDTELEKIVAWKFGDKKVQRSDPREFDNNSAVFDQIKSGTVLFEGKTYYAYEIDLVDQNGNHKVTVEFFTEPNLDYERSKATMELVNRTPQLRKIYDAFAHVLAEQTTVDTNSPPTDTAPEPILELEQQFNQATP